MSTEQHATGVNTKEAGDTGELCPVEPSEGVGAVLAKIVGVYDALYAAGARTGVDVDKLVGLLVTEESQQKIRELVQLKVLLASAEIVEASMRAAKFPEGFNDRKMLLSMAGMVTAKSEIEGGDKPVTVVEIVMNKTE